MHYVHCPICNKKEQCPCPTLSGNHVGNTCEECAEIVEKSTDDEEEILWDANYKDKVKQEIKDWDNLLFNELQRACNIDRVTFDFVIAEVRRKALGIV